MIIQSGVPLFVSRDVSGAMEFFLRVDGGVFLFAILAVLEILH